MLQIGQHGLTRRKVDRQFGPVLGIEIGKTAIEQGFRCRDQLDHRRHTLIERLLYGGQQARQLHREQKLCEKPLHRTGKAAACSGQRLTIQRLALKRIDHTGGGKRCFHVPEYDRPALRIGVEVGDLSGCQLVFEHVVFDAGIGQRAGAIDAHALELAGNQFERGYTACPDAFDQARPIRKLCPLTPQPKPCGIGKVADVRGTCSRGIDNPCPRQPVLQLYPCEPLLRGLAGPEPGIACSPLSCCWRRIWRRRA